MKIGICGGTFDPFHRGHLDPVLAVRDQMEWSRIFYIPAFRQPFKTDRDSVSGCHRFAMAVLATQTLDEVFVSPRELDRGTISYTVETLRELRAENPQATLDWIIGDDNLARLDEWKELDRIFELANFVVLTRSGGQAILPARTGRIACPPLKRGTHGDVVLAENKLVPVSSTEVRRRVRAGETIDDLVDSRVSRYIHHNGLYREAQQ